MQPIEQFQKALELQQQKKEDEAAVIYLQLLDQSRDATKQNHLDLTPEMQADISYNLALVFYSQKKYAQSYVYNQRALLLQPRHKQAQQLSTQISTEFRPQQVVHETTVTEQLQKWGLNAVPTEVLWFGAVIFLALIIRSTLGWIILRKKAEIETSSASHNHLSYPLKNAFFVLLFLTFSLLAGVKLNDESTPKGLIKNESVVLMATPGANQAQLTELAIGTLVHILRVNTIENKTYLQIKYPGSIAGWVPEEAVEIISLPKN